MAAPEETRWWSWRRQRLDRTARGIDDALKSVIAITSAHPSGPLSLLARVPRMMWGMYDGAIRSRAALRLPAMRRALWMLAADTAHIPFQACRGTGASESNLLRRNGVGPEHWNTLRERVLEACAQPASARDIKAAVGGDAEKVGAVLTVLAATGEVLRVQAPSLTSNAFTFVAMESWLGRPLAAMPRDEALTFLAGDYLQAYGPVTVDDFTWWTGLPRIRCEQALVSHEPISMGDGYLLWPAHLRAFEGTRPQANRVNLLPAWDAYPMGYADRSRMGEPRTVAAAFDRAGNSLPIVLVEGRIAGLWDFALDRGQSCTITISLFDEGGARLWEAVEAEAGAVAHLFQARSLNLVRSRTRTAAGAAASIERAVTAPAQPRRTPARTKKVARKAGAARKRPTRKAVSRAKPAATRRPSKTARRASGAVRRASTASSRKATKTPRAKTAARRSAPRAKTRK